MNVYDVSVGGRVSNLRKCIIDKEFEVHREYLVNLVTTAIWNVMAEKVWM